MIEGYNHKIVFPNWEIDTILNEYGRAINVEMRSDILSSCVYRFKIDYFESQFNYSKAVKLECTKRLSEAERFLKFCMLTQGNKVVL